MRKTLLIIGLLAVIALGVPRPAAAHVSVSVGLPGLGFFLGIPAPVVYGPPVYAPPLAYGPPVAYGPPPVYYRPAYRPYYRPYYRPAYVGGAYGGRYGRGYRVRY